MAGSRIEQIPDNQIAPLARHLHIMRLQTAANPRHRTVLAVQRQPDPPHRTPGGLEEQMVILALQARLAKIKFHGLLIFCIV